MSIMMASTVRASDFSIMRCLSPGTNIQERRRVRFWFMVILSLMIAGIEYAEFVPCVFASSSGNRSLAVAALTIAFLALLFRAPEGLTVSSRRF